MNDDDTWPALAARSSRHRDVHDRRRGGGRGQRPVRQRRQVTEHRVISDVHERCADTNARIIVTSSSDVHAWQQLCDLSSPDGVLDGVIGHNRERLLARYYVLVAEKKVLQLGVHGIDAQ
jgi:hypothetical protein